MSKLNVLVIGNCQARPIGHCLSQLNSNITILEPLIVHLLQQCDIEVIQQKLALADVVISQQLNDSYHIEILKTKTLRQQMGSKLVVIPNIFLTKFCPDLVYISSPEIGRITSMLDIYHSRTVFNSWTSKESIENVVNKLNDKYFWLEQYENEVIKSVDELQKRDTNSDLTVYDVIEQVAEKSKPFYTFNHPSNEVLSLLSKKILSYINESCTGRIKLIKEPLAVIVAPTFTGAASAFDYRYEATNYCVGFQPKVSDGKIISKGIRKVLSNLEFVKYSFELYDKTLSGSTLLNLRFTPSY